MIAPGKTGATELKKRQVQNTGRFFLQWWD
jgi:hypothetical protein